MSVRIAPSTIAELESAGTIAALLAEYAAECAIEGLPPPAAKVEQYRQLEAMGLLVVIAAWRNEAGPAELIGYITVLAAPLPHYSITVAVSESFFVAAAHRHSLAGLRLLDAAERRAAAIGSPGLLVSAPFGGALALLLPRIGYVETNQVFFKRTLHEDGLAVVRATLPAMASATVDQVRRVEDFSLAHLPQDRIATEHVFHAGMYARTIMLPPNCLLTGSLIKIPTLLIVNGHVQVHVGDDAPLEIRGHAVLPAAAGRKQIVHAVADTWLTMVFATPVRTVDAAERAFTDEHEKLFSHRNGETVVMGE